MKPNQVVLLGVTSFLASSLSISSTMVGLSASNTLVAQNQTVALMTGTFVAAEVPTQGTARIVTQNGHRYLELDSAFSTSNQGPDLHVLLDSSQKPPKAYQTQSSGSYVNLGKLHKFKGVQRYPIPDAINLASFKSVNIWCRMANATFGYAPLRSASTASNQ